MNFEVSPGLDLVDHVVAIGASAGGLEALEALFDNMPVDTGAAFVVVTHLSPDFKSIMDELLGRRTAMPVHVVEDGETLRSNCVYVIPPGKDMIVQTGRLFLTDRTMHGAPALPIDLFFGSLAREYGRRGTAVILSGTGADGARGARAVHNAGGCVIAQSLDSARFDGMPRAAADTGVVDMMLAPEAIGPAIATRLAREGAIGDVEPSDIREGEGRIVTRILELVLGGANVDFSEYKKTTVMRRIAKRMQAAGLPSLGAYLEELERTPEEARALAHDLLIVVTEFFRDPGAFAVLTGTVMPELIAESSDERPIRIWVPGVATGQEAYSIAMLLREAADKVGRDPRVQIFATDVNPIALEKAASGLYTENEMVNVSPGRREAFFIRTDEGMWQAGPDIRNWIVFAPHNMLRDPPFINTDLISCRNALIYFEVSAQQKALSLFHFSLAGNGFLLLGPSESVGDDTGRFEPVDQKWRLFRKRAADRRDSVNVSDLISRNRWTVDPASRRRGTSYGQPRLPNASALQHILDLYAPPGLLVGRDRELLHVVGAGRDYLEGPQSGPFTQDVVKLVKEPLRVPVASGIERALRTGEEVVFTGADGASGSSDQVIFRVQPLRTGGDGAPDRIFIAFGSRPKSGDAPVQIESVHFDKLAEQRIAFLEDALRAERDNLQAMLEQLETSNEELQSTNEELMTANEELQSTNEELHSVNEELYTVNAEYERKNEELTQLSKDVSSLLQATGVGVVFVDRGLLVRRFTSNATRVINLIGGDEGRHLSHITHTMAGFDLCGFLEQAMASGEAAEQECSATDGTVWTVRAVPVKDGRAVSGAVVSLIDVSRLFAAETEARSRTAELRLLLGWVGAVSLQFCAKGRLVRGSGDWEAFTGQPFEAIHADNDAGWLEVIHPDDRPAVAEAWRGALDRMERFRVAARLQRPGGGWRPAVIEGGPESDGGKPLGWFVYVRDAAEAAGALREAAASERRAAALAALAFSGTYAEDPSGAWSESDAGLASLLGVPPGRTDGGVLAERLTPASRLAREAAIAARDETGGRWSVDVEMTLAKGRAALFRDRGMEMTGEDGRPELIGAISAIAGDDEPTALAAEIVRSGSVEVIVIDPETMGIVLANSAALSALGYAERELSRTDYTALLPEYDRARLASVLAPMRDGEVPEVALTTFALCRDGTTYDVALTFRPVQGGRRVAAIGRNISERRRIEETLRRRTEALVRANRDLERFAIVASGSLAAPLRRIASHANAARTTLGNGDAAEVIGAIEAETAEMEAHVAQLMAYARSVPRDENVQPVALSTVAKAAIASRRTALGAAKGKITLGDLPTVRGSAARLQLLFETLIDIALRHRAPRRAPVIRVESDGAGAVLLRDNGRGLDWPSGAEPGAEGEAADGLGIGLALCQRIVETHGGHMTAQNLSGKGTELRLVFPVS